MPLQNYQYDTIMREYSKTQSQNRRILEERTQEIYKKIPRIHEIDEEVATLSAKKARALLSGESSGLEDLKAAISLLSQERNALLSGVWKIRCMGGPPLGYVLWLLLLCRFRFSTVTCY